MNAPNPDLDSRTSKITVPLIGTFFAFLAALISAFSALYTAEKQTKYKKSFLLFNRTNSQQSKPLK